MLSGFTKCPGLFYATPAQDGILSRIRIPGGILNSKQCRAIAEIADLYGGGYVDVTNRANLQIREIHQGINAEVLKRLQKLGLGSNNTAVDQIRNIMTSPTAGIDPQELVDTRPFVQAWDNYIKANSQLSALSAKFSVCFDGGGIVSVSDRVNDIVFAAVLVDGNVYFRLGLSVGAKGKPAKDTGILLPLENCLPVLAALADVYLAHIDASSKHKLRLREVVNSLGCENYLQEVQQRLAFPLSSLGQKEKFVERTATKYHHIGIHPQRQPSLFYLGVVLPLGRIETMQILGLAELAEKYGSGTLRLTPRQNILLTDIPQQWVADVQSKMAALGLDCSVSNINSVLVACSGKRGCAASITDTKGDALALAEYLKNRVSLDSPVNIHFSGCAKSCAQHSKSDITLLGVSVEEENGTVEGYRVYVGVDDNDLQFGREYQFVTVAKLPALIERMLLVYKTQRLNHDETFREFANRYQISQLKQLCDRSHVLNQCQ
ncbi:precorrin-3B synthase [Nostoc sp. T09]|uniref:precorrin-3B synthase n=1 Tax=Nostoc sp. T09 TaxID=1932621 RepID=UPI000A38BC2A|nr:precorrin-3B synthase [Nostoc sp. T09]OUL36498.1 precorrin-3B synthase [Nostoc sp. T09]